MVVVSPLVALMKDQVKALTDKGAQATYIQDKFDNAVKLKLTYSVVLISPELLLGDKGWVDIFRSGTFSRFSCG